MKAVSTGRVDPRHGACTMNSRLMSSKSTSRSVRALKLLSGFALLIVGGVLALPGFPARGFPAPCSGCGS